MHIRHAVVLSTAVLFAAACSDDSMSPSGTNGALSFTFTGSGGGSFNVAGALPTSASAVGSANAAGAAQDADFNTYDVLGVKARTGGRYDAALLTTGRLTAGTTDIDLSGCDPDVSTCAEFVFLTNVSNTDQEFDLLCALVTGSVTVVEVTSSRIRGTFEGTGSCTDQSLQNPTAFATTNGSFDVPLGSVPGGFF